MNNYKILRRQFTAKGASEDKLNKCVYTSKYMPSYKYCIQDDKGNFLLKTFVKKSQAVDYIKEKNKPAEQVCLNKKINKLNKTKRLSKNIIKWCLDAEQII